MRGRAPWGLLAVVSGLLSLLMTYPVWFWPHVAAIGSQESDTIKHLWTLWWMRAEFWTGKPGLHTDLVVWPTGLSLFPIEPLHGVLAVLLPISPVPLSNLLALVDLFVTGLCGGWLGWLVARNRSGAVAGAVLLLGSSWTAFTLHVGVGELRQVWWLPLCLGLLEAARQRPSWGRSAAAGLALAGAAVCALYYGLFLAMAAVIHSLFGLLPEGPGGRLRRLGGLGLAAGLALGLTLPAVAAFSGSYGETGAQLPEAVLADGRLGQTLQAESAHWWEVFRAAVPNSERQVAAYGGGRYLGPLGLGLGLLGWVARPRSGTRWGLMVLVGLLFAAGPLLWLGDSPWMSGGRPVELPFGPLNHLLARHAAPLHFPARFLALATVGLAVLGAQAVGRWRGLLLVALLSVGVSLVADRVDFPRAVTRLPDFSALQQLPGQGPLVDLSLAAISNPERRTAHVAAQLATGRPVQGMPIERLDMRARGIQAELAELGLVRAMATNRGWPEDVRPDLEKLATIGFEAMMLTGPDVDGEARRRIQGVCGPGIAAGTGRERAQIWALPCP